jgi:hypothetical protein
MKHRVPRYDIGTDNATRPDIVSAANDWDEEDWSRSVELDERRAQELKPYGALLEPPPRWNEPTIPDLPLRLSMAAPVETPAPKETAIPRSGPRHRAVSAPPAAPVPVILDALPKDQAPAPAFALPKPKRRVSLRAPLVAALTGLAAALGAALGNGSVTSWLERVESRAEPPDATTPAAVTKLTPVRTPSLGSPPGQTAATVPAFPVMRFGDLPLAATNAPDGGDANDAGSKGRTVAKRRRL